MSGLTEFPDLLFARQLLNAPWSSIETQRGEIPHRSLEFSEARAVPSMRIHSQKDILLYCVNALKGPGNEVYGLRFGSMADEWCLHHINTARPGFKVVDDFPPYLSALKQFQLSPPLQLEVGLGHPMTKENHSGAKLVPIYWCCFRSAVSSLLIYADFEIPLNIGLIEDGHQAQLIRNYLPAVSVLNFS